VFLAALLLLQSQPLPERRLVEDLRLPSASADVELSVIASVVEIGDRIYLSDWRTPAIHHFDSRGGYRGVLGRDGDGPGEYRRPVVLGARADTLWVWDPTQRRATFWGPDGKFIRTAAPLSGSGFGAGTVLADGGLATIPSWSSSQGQERRVTGAVVGYGPDGRFRDTLFTLPVSGRGMAIEAGAGSFLVSDQPFSDAPILGLSQTGDGFLRVDRAAAGPAVIELTRYEADGRVRWRRSIPHAGAPFDRSLVDSVVRTFTHPANPQAPVVPAERVLAVLEIPPRAIPVLTAGLGRDGSIWLRRPVPVGRPARYTVLSATGVPSFEVTLPPRSRLMTGTMTALWVVSLDEDDLPTAVRYRIQR
jgi:hypothetical protein